MERGLYIAASGMLAQQVRQDQIANDLANSSTPGYKADRAARRSFEDMLLQNSQTGRDGRVAEHGRPRSRAIVTSLTQGPLQQTGDPLDIALDGAGFLAVATAAGVRYTRDGQLIDRRQRPPSTVTGYLVLGTTGSRSRSDRVRTPDELSIDKRGAVSVGGRTVGTPGRGVADRRHQGGRHPLHRHAPAPAGRHDRPAGLPRGLRRRARPGDGGHDRLVPLPTRPAQRVSSRSTTDAGPRRQLGRQRHRA